VKLNSHDLILDFDAAMAEEKASSKKIVIKFLNEEFVLPAKIPFNFSVFFLRYCYKKINGTFTIVMPEDKLIQYIELMFGKEFLNKLERNRDPYLSFMFVFTEIVPKVMKEWGYDINVDPEKIKSIQKKIMSQES